MIRMGLGGMTTPVATIEDTLGYLIDSGVKHMILQGSKIIGQIADAIKGPSSLKQREYLYFSVAAPGLVSIPKAGLMVTLRNPQWNSINVFEGTTSLFSKVLLILKCMTDNLHSLGNKVLAINFWLRVKQLAASMSEGTSKTIFTQVPFRGSPSSDA